jgi:hypothetical protein
MFKKDIIYCVFLILLLAFNNAFADEPVVIVSEGEYVMGAGESMEVSEEKAKRAAIQKAAEQAGAYVKSYTKVKNLALESDVIEVIANHSMKVEVINKKKTVVGDVDAIKFYVKIKASLSQKEIEANLKKVMQDQSIVEEYSRLKAGFEKQNKEMEKLKRQLELATGGDKQKIAKLISEEERKYKASLWLERAQSLFDIEEKLKAYEKALELNPDMPQAYLGIAKVLEDKGGEPLDDKERGNKLEALKEAVENLNRAISLEENYAEAYALRAEILYKIKWLEKSEENEEGYDRKILKDIDRALALNAPNKGELYYLRSSIYLDELQNAELDQAKTNTLNPEIIEEYLNKAIAEIDQAMALCGNEDLKCMAECYRRKANAYVYAMLYYARRGNDSAKEKKFSLLRDKFFQKANELERQEKAKGQEEEAKWQEEVKDLRQTEYGKINYEIEYGWKERIMGISFEDLKGKSEEEQKKIGKQVKAKLKKKISTGKASAEEYIFMSIGENSQTRKNYFGKGISLIEKRNPQGIEALLFVQWLFYYAPSQNENDDTYLNYLNKAKAIVDRNLSHAQKALSINEFMLLISEMEKAKSDTERLNVTKKLCKLDRQQAEAFQWLTFALIISHQKAEIYERLDLPIKAREEYLYLCNTFKDDESCKNAERLKK